MKTNRENPMENQDTYQKAKKKAEEKLGFYIHLIVYFIVNCLLIVINLIFTRGHFWAKWPMMGWAVGVLFHGLSVYVFKGESTIPERMIQKELEKEAQKDISE